MDDLPAIQKKKKISSPLALKWLIFKGFFMSLWYEIWLKNKNFNRLKSLHDMSDNGAEYEYSEKEKKYVGFVSRAIKYIEKKAPWRPRCYNLAMTSRKMLKEKNIPCTLKIGFKKKDNQIVGHAWVHCKQTVVSGYISDLRTYKPLKPIKN